MWKVFDLADQSPACVKLFVLLIKIAPEDAQTPYFRGGFHLPTKDAGIDMKIQNNSPEHRLLSNIVPKFHYILCWLLLGPVLGNAQSLTGQVRDADNGLAIGGATVTVYFEPTGKKNAQGPFERSSNSDGLGHFSIENLVPGYYRVVINAPDYESRTLVEVDVAAGKVQHLQIALQHSAIALPVLTVNADPGSGRRQQVISEIPLTREQTMRFPATFFDPARLAMAYPGVANNDDQANGLIVRGNNPGSLRWKLEGVDIVNPNHQPNAGTFSDRPVAAAGGVLLFSAQMLDNSALLTGSYPAGYGDATGGIMDIYLRRGHTEKPEFTVQLGLIGLDVAAEGPLSKQKNSSYIANYRYSTVGFLNKLGVSFGNEQIDFQDFSFKLSRTGRQGGEWSLFGVGGIGQNLFKPQADSADILTYKDFFNIDFDTKTGILGLNYHGLIGPQTRLRWTTIWSGQRNHREASGLGLLDIDEQTETRLGTSLTVFHRINSFNRLTAGVLGQRATYSGMATATGRLRYQGELQMFTLQPWANWEWRSAGERWEANLGVHSNLVYYTDGIGTVKPSVEPRAALTWRPDARQRITLAYGYHSQLNPLWYLAEKQNGLPGRDDPFHREQALVRAHHLGLKYALRMGDHWSFKSELFQQWLQGIPVATLTPSTLSLLNISESQSLPALQAEGKGENKGLELSLERFLSRGWSLAANTTLFQSTYTDAAGVQRSTRWDLGRIANLTAGKEWMLPTKGKRYRRLGVNTRFVWAGGLRAMPVDAAASAQSQTTVFDTANGFSIRQPDFFRCDLRLYLRRSLGDRRNSTFALEFQNLTNQQNTAYQFYDPYTKQVETKHQLGTIPNLSWRMEF